MSKQNPFVKSSVVSLSALIVCSVFAFPANAASSQWEDLGGGKARVVAMLDPTSNKVSGIVEVKLEPGWSTYWRYPGSTGIPPNFNFSGSQFYSAGDVKFPAPSLLETHDIRYAGYKKHVSFPFEGDLLAVENGTINLDLLIGVCSDICIPAKANFEISASDLLQSDPRAVQDITLANLTIPKPAKEDTILNIDKDGDTSLNITVKHNRDFGTPKLFVEGPNDWYLKPAVLVTQADEHAVFKLDISQAPKNINPLDSKLRYTLVTGSTGVEIER